MFQNLYIICTMIPLVDFALNPLTFLKFKKTILKQMICGQLESISRKKKDYREKNY